MTDEITSGPRLGVTYYPEQWPEERWADDARYMRETGIRIVRLAEFAWARLEPAEGEFDVAWLDRAIATLADHELQIVLGTPTATPPPWLTYTYLDVLLVDEYGHTMSPGTRRHVCPTNQTYRELSRRIVTRLAERYGDDERIIGWQIDNEFGCHNTTRCYCEQCADAFHDWLHARYGELDALNAAWGTDFWSAIYTEWSQIPLPKAAPAEHNPSLLLDFYHFSSDSWGDFQREQTSLLRELASDQFITHNFMGFFDELDSYDIARDLDFVAWDNYHYHGATPVLIAAAHDLTWGFKRRNFWVMEQQVGEVNWTRHNSLFPTGMARLKAYQAIAHGADGVVFFRWRAARAGSEQYHSGILDHAGRPIRAHAELQQAARELSEMETMLVGTEPAAQVALLHDYHSRWALQIQPHNQLLDTRDVSDTRVSHSPVLTASGQPLTGRSHFAIPFVAPYEALYRQNIGCAIIPPSSELTAVEYPLAIAAALHVVDGDTAARLENYVMQGGTLILGPRAGYKQADNRVFDVPQPGLLTALAGVTVREFDSLPADRLNGIHFTDDQSLLDVGIWCELLEPTTAKVLAEYTDDFYKGTPAITVNEYGEGRVYYVGTMGGTALYNALLRRLMPEVDLAPVLNTHEGIEARVRAGEDGRKILFLLNHTGDNQQVTLNQTYGDLLTGESVSGVIAVAGYDVCVLAK